MRTLSTAVFLKLRSGRREDIDDFPPFLYSLTLHLNLQVISLPQFMICFSSGGTLNTDRRQEYEELWLCSLQMSEKTFTRGGIKYIKKSGHQVSKKSSVLNLAEMAEFHDFSLWASSI